LTRALLECRDAATGKPVVEWVRRRDELYHGPHVHRAPDLAIHWRTEFVISGLVGKDGKAISKATWLPRRAFVSGGHRPDGILIAWGPNIRPAIQLADAQITDVCPTLLYLMEHPVPDDMDGKVLTTVLAEEYVQTHPIQRAGVVEGTAGVRREAYDEREAAAIEERLRGLGYVE